MGGIGTTYNALGKLYVAASDAMRSGDLLRAQSLQQISQDYVSVLIETGVVPGVKLTLEILGYETGPARRPMALKMIEARDMISRFLDRSDVKVWLA